MSTKELIRPSWRRFVERHPKAATMLKYYKVFGHFPNLNNPKTLTEKLQWLKLNVYYHNPKVSGCIDKYLVRNYVEECGCPEILNKLYGVWDSVDDINWDSLPNQFAIKCNHGCGYNIICNNKDQLNIEEAKTKLKSWMNERYGLDSVELLYSDIQPRIICEKYIEGFDSNNPPTDYKFFCSYGMPKLLYVINDNHQTIDYYTPEWEWISVKNGTHPNSSGPIMPKPKHLRKMLDYASMLSKEFPIVRVDLYCEGDSIIFGELTFLATGGVFKLDPISYDEEFGKLFDIQKLIDQS